MMYDPSRQLDSLFHTWASDVTRAYQRSRTEHERRIREGDRTLEQTLVVLKAILSRLRHELEGIDAPLPAHYILTPTRAHEEGEEH